MCPDSCACICHYNHREINCCKGFEEMTWDWSKVDCYDLSDESLLDDFYFGFGQLRKAIWYVEPKMKYVMLKTSKNYYSDN